MNGSRRGNAAFAQFKTVQMKCQEAGEKLEFSHFVASGENEELIIFVRGNAL